MRAILPMIVLIITHQALILLLIGLASGVGALAGGGALGGIAMFVLGLGAMVPMIGLIAGSAGAFISELGCGSAGAGFDTGGFGTLHDLVNQGNIRHLIGFGQILLMRRLGAVKPEAKRRASARYAALHRADAAAHRQGGLFIA